MNGTAMQVLSIFIWKQVFLSVLKRNRCILIKYSPFIEWHDETDSVVMGQRNEIQMSSMIATQSDVQIRDIGMGKVTNNVDTDLNSDEEEP